MTEAKHTPGPWRYYVASSPDNTGGYDCAIVDEKGRIIAEAFAHVGYDTETGQIRQRGGAGVAYDQRPAEANACLIAAAPELLEVLQDVFDEADGLSGATIQAVRAAIAKARGEG